MRGVTVHIHDHIRVSPYLPRKFSYAYLRSNICAVGKSLTSSGFVQVQMQVETHFVSDVLRGNDTTEMKITLLRYIDDEMPPDDE